MNTTGRPPRSKNTSAASVPERHCTGVQSVAQASRTAVNGPQDLDILLDEAAFLTAQAASRGEPTLALEAVHSLRRAQAARKAARAWAATLEHSGPDDSPAVHEVLMQLVTWQTIWTDEALVFATASLSVAEGEAA